MSDFEAIDVEKEAITDLIAEPLPLSGINIIYEDGRYGIRPPVVALDLSDDELIAYANGKFGTSADDFLGEDREENLREIRHIKKHEYIGGCGITSRSLDDVREEFPLIDEILAEARGKVVILGSGFSTLALDFAKLHTIGQLGDPPILVDLFDYRDAEKDFSNLRARFGERRIDFPFSQQTRNLTDIVTAMDSGHLSSIKYRVGDDAPPRAILDADLVINIQGPPPHSLLAEQLSLLRIGGRFVTQTDLRKVSLENGFNLRSIPKSRTDFTASIITRTQ